MQLVSMVTIFQETPKEKHMQAIKRIFKFLKDTVDFGMWYPRG